MHRPLLLLLGRGAVILLHMVDAEEVARGVARSTNGKGVVRGGTARGLGRGVRLVM